MHGRGDDEEEERRRQARENQGRSFEDRWYGSQLDDDDGRRRNRRLRLKQTPLYMTLTVHAVLDVAMKQAGFRHLPDFFEFLLSEYLKSSPLDETALKSIPGEEELQERALKKRERKDGK